MSKGKSYLTISFHGIGNSSSVLTKASVKFSDFLLTYGKQVRSTLLRDDASSLAPWTSEEADMLLHVQDAVQQGYEKDIICTVDTDVLVLYDAISSY